MPFPPSDKTMEGLLRDHETRVTLVERRLAIGSSGSSAPYDANPGMIMPFAGTVAPTGWLMCDGSAVSRSTYSALYDAIGTAYGPGDGSTTFNLPNLKGRVPVGQDPAQAEFDAMGEAGGAKTHTLTVGEMPSHTHLGPTTNGVAGPNYEVVSQTAAGIDYTPNSPTAATGGGGAHNNLQPYVVTNYIISTGEGVGGGGAHSTGGSGSYQAAAGLVSPYAGTDTAVPAGWLLCDGRLVPRAAYPALFAAIGTTYGAGDGSTTFGLPNYKGRVLVGRDAAQGEFDVLGETGGEKAHVLTIPELPDHGHAQYVTANPGSGGSARIDYTQDGAGSAYPQGVNTGGMGGQSLPHNNLQPYAVANYIISTGSGVGGGGSSTPALPDPVTVFTTSDQLGITQAGGVWSDLPGAAVTLNLPYPMWVEVEFGSEISSNTAGVYGMVGVNVTGALNLHPITDQATGVGNRFAFAPYALGVQDAVRQQSSKVILLPKGISTLQLQSFRNSTSGAQYLNYTNMIVIPLSWVGAPGAVVEPAVTGRATIAANSKTPATSVGFVVNWSTYEGPLGVWSAAQPARFILNKPGKWRVYAKVRMTDATVGYGYLNIWKNSANINATEGLDHYGVAGCYPVTQDIVTSNGADFIEIVATNSNGNQTIIASNCLFTLEWIGA